MRLYFTCTMSEFGVCTMPETLAIAPVLLLERITGAGSLGAVATW